MDDKTIKQEIKRIINDLRVRDDTANCIAELAKLGPINELDVYEALTEVREKTDIPLRVLDPMYRAETATVNLSGWHDMKATTGKPASTYKNFRLFCFNNNITTRYNLMTHECDVLLGDEPISEEELLEMVVEAGLNGYHKTIGAASKRMADGEKPYHPVAAWLEGHEWDGIDRIGKLVDKLNMRDCPEALARTYLTRWLLGGMDCVYNEDGTTNQSMLVLHGKSGCGKTLFFEDLLPQKYFSDWFGNAGRTPWDKRNLRVNTKKWLLEFESFQELLVHGYSNSSRRTTLADVGLFLNRNCDVLSKYKNNDRHMFFCAGITSKDRRIAFAADRHYFVIGIGTIKHEIIINARQIWLQVKVLYDNGQRHRLLDEEFRRHMRYANVMSTRPDWVSEKPRKNDKWLRR